MKERKSKAKRQRPKVGAEATTSESDTATSQPVGQPTGETGTGQRIVEVRLVAPPLEVLMQEALEEPDHQELSAYIEVIRVLRRKRLSYREIADWLNERGIEGDRNAVYRVFTRSLSDSEAADDAQQEEEEARNEAERSRS